MLKISLAIHNQVMLKLAIYNLYTKWKEFCELRLLQNSEYNLIFHKQCLFSSRLECCLVFQEFEVQLKCCLSVALDTINYFLPKKVTLKHKTFGG